MVVANFFGPVICLTGLTGDKILPVWPSCSMTFCISDGTFVNSWSA